MGRIAECCRRQTGPGIVASSFPIVDTNVPHPRVDPKGLRPEPSAPTLEETEEALGRVLGSTTFSRSERLRRFLAFIVAEHIADHADRLKEYALAVEVFDRGDEFDPRIDNIVRVEAGRLRAKLREYYADEAPPWTQNRAASSAIRRAWARSWVTITTV